LAQASLPNRAEHAHDWKSDYRQWLPLLLLAWASALLLRDRFISDWDAFDYTAYAVRNVPTSLGLGRALFLGYNHALWELMHHWFGMPAEQSHLILTYGAIVQSGPAVVGLYALYKELTASRLAATCGALLVALSPLYLIYSGRGMSEIPGALAFSWSLWWMMRSLRLGYLCQYLGAAALFGLSANIREFAVFYLPVVALAARVYGVRWRLCLTAFAVAALAAVAGIIFWSLYGSSDYLSSVIGWYQLSARERQVHPVTMRNLWLLPAYAFICSPAATLAAPFALRRLWSERPRRALLLMGCFGLLSDLVLLANHDVSVNPRYLLTGLLGLAGVCGWHLAKQYPGCKLVLAGTVALTAIGLIGTGVYNYRQISRAIAARDYIAKIADLPANSVFIVGKHSPLVNFYRGVGARPRWHTISSGSGWPDDRLGAVIDGYLAEGRPMYVDFDPQLWEPGMRARNREAPGLEMIQREYRLESVRASLYRIWK